MIPGALSPLLALWLAATVVWVALPAGSAGSGGQTLARVAAFAALAVAAVRYEARPGGRRMALALAALAALAGLGLAQSLRWPRALARLVSPEHVELSQQARELLRGTGIVESRGVVLSLGAELSRSAALTLLAVAAVLFAAFVVGARRRFRRWLILAIAAGGLLQVVYGLRAWMAGTAPRLRGTFVNPNHLAYALGIALAVAFAWAAWGAREQRFAVGIERRALLLLPPIFVWLALGVGLLATGSRAGFVACGAALLAQCLLLPAVLPEARRSIVPKALGALALLGLAALAARGTGRLGETTVYELALGLRPTVWRHGLELWRRFPATGTGLGTFGESFPLVQPAETTELFWRRAHNDPLELLVTGGVVGFALGVVLLAGVALPLVRVLRRGERSEDRAAALAALGALVSVGAHELMDFGLTLPGISFPFAVLIGAAAAATIRTNSSAGPPGRDEAAAAERDRSPNGEPSRDR